MKGKYISPLFEKYSKTSSNIKLWKYFLKIFQLLNNYSWILTEDLTPAINY